MKSTFDIASVFSIQHKCRESDISMSTVLSVGIRGEHADWTWELRKEKATIFESIVDVPRTEYTSVSMNSNMQVSVTVGRDNKILAVAIMHLPCFTPLEALRMWRA